MNHSILCTKITDSDQKIKDPVGLMQRRAQNLFTTHQLLCSESVLVVLNHGFCGGLTEDVAIRLASALPVGLGGSGCICGALSGGTLALGLFLGRDRSGARDKGKVSTASKELHNRFRQRYDSTCCRILTKKVRRDPKAHFSQCAELTGWGARLAAEVILKRRPELTEQVDWTYLKCRDSMLGTNLKRAFNLIR